MGKTHLAVGLGVKAVEAGYSVLFLTLEALMTRLTRARHENRLDRSLQQLSYPKLLILDEIGYLPLSRDDASLFFRLLARRYERGSLIVTSNKGFVDWGEVFSDPVLATAILDRLLHQSTTVNIKGDSYRLKEKRRAGLWAVRRSPRLNCLKRRCPCLDRPSFVKHLRIDVNGLFTRQKMDFLFRPVVDFSRRP